MTMQDIKRGSICIANYNSKNGLKKGKFIIYSVRKHNIYGLIILRNVDFSSNSNQMFMPLLDGKYVNVGRLYHLLDVYLLDENISEVEFERIAIKAGLVNSKQDITRLMTDPYSKKREKPDKMTRLLFVGKTTPK